jgi:hypothetical protein
MNRTSYRIAFPAAFIVVLAAFLSTIIIATVNPVMAASGNKKSSAAAQISAVDLTESRIKTLHSAIKITGDQEDLWKNFTQVMRENAKEMDALSKDNSENTKNMNAVEHMKFHNTITGAHLNQQNKLIPPFEALYASMSDEQKKITDTIFRTGKHGKHKIQ